MMFTAKLKPKLLALFTLALASACQDPTPEPFPLVAGGVCSWQSASQCADTEQLLVCAEREWTEMSCAQFCDVLGLLPSDQGCVVSEQGVHSCPCETTPDSCTGMTLTCTSDESIEGCIDGEPEVFECAEVCAALDPPRLSLGCDSAGWSADCVCTLDATSCDPTAPPRCDDIATLASCVEESWQIEPCSTACSPEQSGYCSTAIVDDQPVSGCICVDS